MKELYKITIFDDNSSVVEVLETGKKFRYKQTKHLLFKIKTLTYARSENLMIKQDYMMKYNLSKSHMFYLIRKKKIFQKKINGICYIDLELSKNCKFYNRKKILQQYHY